MFRMRNRLMRASAVAAIAAAALAVAAAPARAAGADAGETEDKFHLADRADSYARNAASFRAAKSHHEQAIAEVVRERQAAGEDYRQSEQYKSALKAVDETFRAYNDRKKQVVEDIRQRDTRYSELKKQADAVAADLVIARANAGISVQQYNELYNRKAVFTREIRALEDDAIAKAGAAQLKEPWDQASQRLAELQANQRQAVESADRVKQATARVVEARTAMDQAGATLAGSASAYAQATALQSEANEYLRRYPPYTSAYGDWGYGWWTGTNTYSGGDTRPSFPAPSSPGLSR